MQKSGSPGACDEQVGCPRKVGKIALSVNIHSDGDRDRLGEALYLIKLIVQQDIAQIDLICLPGNIDIDVSVCPIYLDVAAVEDRLVGGQQTHDPVCTASVVGDDPEPGQGRPLQLSIQEAVDTVFRPQIKQLICVWFERAFIPFCMIF